MGIHYLKTLPRLFELVVRGSKRFEVRLDDRDFREGDVVVLQEWDSEKAESRVADGYTGRECGGVITCVLRSTDLEGGALSDDYVVFGFNLDAELERNVMELATVDASLDTDLRSIVLERIAQTEPPSQPPVPPPSSSPPPDDDIPF